MISFVSFLFTFVGFGLILYGMKFFKVYLFINGLAIGALVGSVLGGIIFGRDGALPFAVVMAIIVGILTIHFYKIMTSISGGGVCGFIGIILSISVGLDSIWVPFIVFFIAGLAITYYLYDYVIIALVAALGVNLMYVGTVIVLWLIYMDLSSFDPIMEYVLHSGEVGIMYYIVLLVVNVYLAILYQKKFSLSNSRADKDSVVLFRRTCITLLGFSLLAGFGIHQTQDTALVAISTAYFSLWILRREDFFKNSKYRIPLLAGIIGVFLFFVSAVFGYSFFVMNHGFEAKLVINWRYQLLLSIVVIPVFLNWPAYIGFLNKLLVEIKTKV